ncbi:ABC transporter ATP-binding protein, partial [Escherichia coli]
ADGMPEININETTPRFEDAFIDLLGGAGTSESPLGAILHTVEGTPGETVIEAKELTKKFGDFAATDHVNFAVKRGEIFGLLGPNGAGKSTTFKMMCGLLVPTSGQALVLGMDLKESSGKARQHLGYMAQKFSLYGNLTVEQNLRFFSGVYGLRGRAQNEKISRMSEAFGLKSIASHATDELPLGFKQRLALACSLMHEPDILFLDEPTSGVDPGMDKPAVAPLDCTIHAGYVTGLVGPDGAGKTTLMRMLAGLLKPDSGSATVIGFDPIKNDGALHAVLGYMPQKFGLYEDLTVMENLNLYADLRSVTGEARKQTFARLLEFTSLGPFTGRLAGKLSGGMKQKLGLACTLVGEPKVLLLDEPGVGVDPISRRELWQMVHELAGEGMLILWSTSYLDEAEQCRDVLLMNEGELLYQGEPTALTQTMAGRSFLMTSPHEGNRKLLQRALKLPQVSDGMIQGKSVRLILKKETTPDDIRH